MIHRFKKLLKAVASISYTLDINDALKRITDECCECLECERALLFVVDFEKNEIWTQNSPESNNRLKI